MTRSQKIGAGMLTVFVLGLFGIHQPDNKCPKCGSRNVEVGNHILSCCDCDWSLIGEHPCDVCGEPSVGASGNGQIVHYRCRQHSLSFGEMCELAKPFVEAVMKG